MVDGAAVLDDDGSDRPTPTSFVAGAPRAPRAVGTGSRRVEASRVVGKADHAHAHADTRPGPSTHPRGSGCPGRSSAARLQPFELRADPSPTPASSDWFDGRVLAAYLASSGNSHPASRRDITREECEALDAWLTSMRRTATDRARVRAQAGARRLQPTYSHSSPRPAPRRASPAHDVLAQARADAHAHRPYARRCASSSVPLRRQRAAAASGDSAARRRPPGRSAGAAATSCPSVPGPRGMPWPRVDARPVGRWRDGGT